MTTLRRSPVLLFAVLVAAGLAGCPRPAKAKHVIIEDVPRDPVEQAKATLDAVYKAVEALDADKFQPLLAQDVVAFGLGPDDFFTDRGGVIEELRRDFIPFSLRGDQLKLFWSRPRIALDDSGRAGWLHDLPRFQRVRDNGKDQFWSLRLTAHLQRAGADHFEIDALHVSMGFPDAELYAEKSDRKLVPPIDPGVSKGRGTDAMVDLTQQMLSDIGVKVEHTSDLDEVALIGTDVADVFEGGAAFKALVKPRLAELKKSNAGTYTIQDGPRSRLAPGGESGWVAANVVLTLKQGRATRKLPPFRALWIFEKEKGVWALVSDHQSLGLKTEQRDPSLRSELPRLDEMKQRYQRKARPGGADGGTGGSGPVDLPGPHLDTATRPDAGPAAVMKPFD